MNKGFSLYSVVSYEIDYRNIHREPPFLTLVKNRQNSQTFIDSEETTFLPQIGYTTHFV